MQRYVHLSEFYKLFAHPVRLGIIYTIGRGERPVQALAKELNISDVVLAQHMARLRRLKIVECRRKGREAFYRLTDPEILAVCKRFMALYQKSFK